MQNIINSFDNLPLIVKIILALPGIDIIWVIYRLIRSIAKENLIGIIIAAVVLIVGFPWLWIVDILCLVGMNKVWWID